MIKNQQNKFLLLSLSLWLNLILSCASNPPDVPVCVEINMSKGFCTNTISDKDYVIDDSNLYNKQTWFDMRPEMVLVPISSWVKIKEWIINMCHKNNQCDQNIQGWDKKLNNIDKKLNGGN